MSLTMTIIIAGATGGTAWVGISSALVWWFNRRLRRRGF